MTEIQINETGLMFVGAAEYWSYLGLRDGYFKKLTDPYVVQDQIFSITSEVGRECFECYLLGFFLGNEVREDEERDKAEKELRSSPVRYGETIASVVRSRLPMG